MNADDLTILFADRMAAIVPIGFHVQAEDGVLWYFADAEQFPGQNGDYRPGRSGTYVRDYFNAHGETVEERTVGAAVQALDDLQDYIDEATHHPWPGDKTPPQAHAQIRGTMLHLWYGTSHDVLLTCEPIQLMMPGNQTDSH